MKRSETNDIDIDADTDIDLSVNAPLVIRIIIGTLFAVAVGLTLHIVAMLLSVWIGDI